MKGRFCRYNSNIVSVWGSFSVPSILRYWGKAKAGKTPFQKSVKRWRKMIADGQFPNGLTNDHWDIVFWMPQTETLKQKFSKNPKFFKINQRVPPLKIFEKNPKFFKITQRGPPFENFQKHPKILRNHPKGPPFENFRKNPNFFKITQRGPPFENFQKYSKFFKITQRVPLLKIFEKIRNFSK